MRYAWVLLAALAFSLSGCTRYFVWRWFNHNYMGDSQAGLQGSFTDTLTTVRSEERKLTVSHDGDDKVVGEYYFDEEDYCDSIVYQHYCGTCVDSRIRALEDPRMSHWVRLKENEYISDRRRGWEISSDEHRNSMVQRMIIERHPGEEVCATITYYTDEMETLEWRKLIKEKKRSNRQ